MLQKPIKCRFLIAKLTKKVKGKKDAIKILNEVKASEENEKKLEIQAKMKIAKYMMSYYDEKDVDDKYKYVFSQYG